MSLNMRNEKWGFALDLPFRLTWYFTSSILFRHDEIVPAKPGVSIGVCWSIVESREVLTDWSLAIVPLTGSEEKLRLAGPFQLR